MLPVTLGGPLMSGTLPTGPHIVLHDGRSAAGLVRYERPAAVRRALLEMTPDDPRARVLTAVVKRSRPPGVMWALASRDELPVLLRARDFPDPTAARRDLRRILSRASRLEVVPVLAANRRAQHGWWWLTLDSVLVLVAGYRARAGDVDTAARTAIESLVQAGQSIP